MTATGRFVKLIRFQGSKIQLKPVPGPLAFERRIEPRNRDHRVGAVSLDFGHDAVSRRVHRRMEQNSGLRDADTGTSADLLSCRTTLHRSRAYWWSGKGIVPLCAYGH